MTFVRCANETAFSSRSDARVRVTIAVAESLWATMKREFVQRYRFASRGDARRAITGWINRYNAVRQHSSINAMTPIEWELQFARRQIQAA